jgi:lipoprotein signal peptidase
VGRSAAISGSAFVAAIAVDLVTKICAVAWLEGPSEILFNNRPHDLVMRLDVCLITIGVVYLLERAALRRGVGRLYATWLCIGVLVGGTLGNGVSTYLWSAGVPDFIRLSDGWMWNVADFEIVFGLLGAAASIVGSAAVAFVRSVLMRPGGDAAS